MAANDARDPKTDRDSGALSGLWVVVTCMGRLAFVQRTLPTVIAQPAIRYCLVDFSCPDRSGDWLESAYPDRIRDGTMMVVRAEGRQFFHKTVALNLGARAAIECGAHYLCFADADTAFAKGAFEELAGLLRPDRFLVTGLASAGGGSIPSLTGLLVLAAGDFQRAGGYDEAFEDWGSEDIEMRLRLHLRLGLAPATIPARLVQPLQHGDWLRTQFHRQRDLRASALRNHALLQARVGEWTGQPLERLPESAKALFFGRHRSLAYRGAASTPER